MCGAGEGLDRTTQKEYALYFSYSSSKALLTLEQAEVLLVALQGRMKVDW